MTLRIGSIGAGGRGIIVKHTHQPDHGVELVAISDTNPQVREQYAQEFGGKVHCFSDHREMLSKVQLDGVFVTTPDYLHEEHALAAIEAGCSIYLEKPMTITIAGCDRVLEAAAARGVQIYVGHNMRFFPVMRKMRQLIEDGAIGQVQAVWCRHFISYGGDAYYKDWHSERRYSTGLLLQKAAHDIDMIHWFAGDYTQRVVAMGKLSVYDKVTDRRKPDEPGDIAWSTANWPPLTQKGLSPVIDVEDHSMVLMQMANGVQANYVQCHYTPDSHRNYTIIGTEGRIENIGDHSTADQWARVCLWNKRCTVVEQGTQSFAIPPIEGSHGGADPLIIADFIRMLRGEPTEGPAPIDARMSVATGCQATESLRNGNVALDVPPVGQDAKPSA